MGMRTDDAPPTGDEVRITSEDADGNVESAVVTDTYVLTCVGDHYLANIQRYANGTTVLTIKVGR